MGTKKFMHDGTLHISGRARTLSLYVSLAVLLFLSVLSARTLMGTYYHGKVPGILDDRSSEESVTLKDLSEETVPAYQDAITTLERAIFFDPSRALYRKALSDIYARIGSWTETMEVLNASRPEGTPRSKETFELVSANIRETIRLNPVNPDYHLAYGHISAVMKNTDAARNEYEKSVNACPGSAALRYAVAMEYLASGLQVDALEQAKILARIDDSYKLREFEHKQAAREHRSPTYLNQIYGSYLLKAFEIVWNTSSKDMNLLRRAVPDNDEARDAYELFLEAKGIEK